MVIGSLPPTKIAGLGSSERRNRYSDCDDPDLKPYCDYLKDRIVKFWRTPEGAEYLIGQVVVDFAIEWDGRVSKVQIVSPSDHPLHNQGIMLAFERAAPFRPIPEKIREERLRMVGTFSYNQPLPRKVRQ